MYIVLLKVCTSGLVDYLRTSMILIHSKYMQEKKTRSEVKKFYWLNFNKEQRKEKTANAVKARWLDIGSEERSAHGKMMVKARQALRGQKLTLEL
jgi:hypothetical protein